MGLFGIGTGSGIAAALFVELNSIADRSLKISAVLMVILLYCAFMLLLFIWEFGNYRIALLIIENSILKIQSAKIEEGTLARGTPPIGGIEVFISCFGILLDSRVIKFNLHDITLKGVIIGPDSISFSYGRGGSDRTLRILCGELGNKDLQSFVERFRYETGVEPVLEQGFEISKKPQASTAN